MGGHCLFMSHWSLNHKADKCGRGAGGQGGRGGCMFLILPMDDFMLHRISHRMLVCDPSPIQKWCYNQNNWGQASGLTMVGVCVGTAAISFR